MKCAHQGHTGFSVPRLGGTTYRVPEPDLSQPKGECVPKLVKPCKSHG